MRFDKISVGDVVEVETERGRAELQVTAVYGQRVFYEVNDCDGLAYDRDDDPGWLNARKLYARAFTVSETATP